MPFDFNLLIAFCTIAALLYFINIIFLVSFFAGILRYKIDLESIQMMLDDDYYYDKEDYDLDDY